MTRTSSTRSGLTYVDAETPTSYRPSLTGTPSRTVLTPTVLEPANAPPWVPAVVATRSSALREASGRSRSLYSGKTAPTDEEVVAIRVSAATATSIDWA